MKIEEYIAIAKDELDQMEKLFRDNNKTDPRRWPLEMEDDEWAEQELAQRFS